MRKRTVHRLTVVALGVALPIFASAGPALAKLTPDDGEMPGPSLGLADTLLLFVVIPIGVFAVIAALSLLPSALSRPRYRPGKPWEHGPRWIGGPTDPSAEAEPTARGGASAEW